jgi:hypothetical protein
MKIRSPDIPVRALGQGCPIYEGVNMPQSDTTMDENGTQIYLIDLICLI